MKKNSFKKLILRIIYIIIPLYILWFLYIEFMPMYYNRPTNTRWYFIKKVLDKTYKIPESNIIFLGESRVNAGIDFTKIPGSFSFASGGSTPVEMYYVLEKYLENYSKPDMVFLSISPRFLTETFAFWPYAVRNDLFTYSDFRDITDHLIPGDTIIGKHPKAKFLLHKLNYIEYYQSDVFYNYMFGGHKENRILINEMLSMNGGRPHPGLKDSCSDLNYETRYNEFQVSKLSDFYLREIFKLCKENNTRLIYDFIPMNESSYKALKKGFITSYKSYIKNLSDEYPQFDISDTLYYYPDSYFGDESHLNYRGKEKFTNYLSNKHFYLFRK